MRSVLVHPPVPPIVLSHRHRVTRLADFLFVDHSAGSIGASFGFARWQRRGVDRRSPKEEPDFLGRTLAFALAVEIDATDVSPGLAKWNGHVITGATRLAKLS